MYRTICLLTLSSFLLAAGCGGGEEEIMLVDHYRVPCYGVGPRLCSLVSEPGSAEQTYFYNGIDGFSQEWGHRYELRVLVTEIANPPADGSSLNYELVEVISDDVVNERFTLSLSSDFVTGDPTTQAFSLLEVRDIACVDTTVCDAIANGVVDGGEVAVELEHSATENEPLTAHSAMAQ